MRDPRCGIERYDWTWNEGRVGASFENPGFSAGAGLFAAEMPIYLKFMSKYWVSGSGATPFYGREREGNPSATPKWHIGEVNGSHSTVASFTGGDVSYYVVPLTKDGELDLPNFESRLPKKNEPEPVNPLTVGQCKLPNGLNMAFAANQVSDAGCSPGICSNRYMALRDVIKEVLCKANWQKIHPTLAGG